MNIKDSINAEMWTKQQYVGDDERCDHNDSIDRIQEAVGEYTKVLEKRIAALEARVDGYERLLDEAFDEYLSGCTGYEVHDILKELLKYAPRRNWEEK